MFKDLPEGQTHYENDGCGIKEHNMTKKHRHKWIEHECNCSQCEYGNALLECECGETKGYEELGE